MQNEQLFLTQSPKPIARASLPEVFLTPCWQDSVSPPPLSSSHAFSRGQKWVLERQKSYSFYVQSTDLCTVYKQIYSIAVVFRFHMGREIRGKQF